MSYTLIRNITLLLLCSLMVLSCDNQKSSTQTLAESMVAQIDTEVDPYFVYEYEQTKFVPEDGKTLLIMGQTLEDIDDYIGAFADKPMPGGWSAYWGIPEFNGITDTHTNETGSSHNHQALVDRFPNTVIQSGMWMVGTWNVAVNTGNGFYDHVIRDYSDWAKSIDRPIYLRIGYEFDGPHNAMNPAEYVKAYRRVVDVMREEGVTNVAFVWHSYIFQPYNNNQLEDYYPGDDYVDWVGVSVFGLLYQDADLMYHGNRVLEFAKEHKKPVMVAESSPTSGIRPNDVEVWNTWFTNFFSVVYNKNIKAISFINANWEAYTFEGISWKDARLTNNEVVSDAWFEETNKDRYLKSSPTLFEELGYTSED